ncbi:DUF2179 domain-containing protein [Ammoniphilus sp. 3BR4]|uniref:DUF2179 domain-containing protein n=1 Tax=Ammoniphilus sp. 3BR4 TaxID=3158265 RepID=UPI003466AB49
MSGLGIIATIFVINIVYVSLFTVRLIFVMKGQRMLASFLSMVEVFVYLIGLNIVLANIDKPLNLAAYCIGWGTGVYLGSKIEEWLALGYVTMQIVVDSSETKLASILRAKGYGVTSWLAEGKEGHRLTMLVLAKRSNEKKLLSTVEELAPKAFLISYDPRYFKGGFWTKRLR